MGSSLYVGSTSIGTSPAVAQEIPAISKLYGAVWAVRKVPAPPKIPAVGGFTVLSNTYFWFSLLSSQESNAPTVTALPQSGRHTNYVTGKTGSQFISQHYVLLRRSPTLSPQYHPAPPNVLLQSIGASGVRGSAVITTITDHS